MEIVNERLLANLSAKDDLAFKLGDTLDVKASIGLVVITFLGTQTAYFIDKHVSGLPQVLQTASVAFLVAATIATIVALWPRDYLMVQPEKNVTSRIPELVNHYAKYKESPEEDVLNQLTLDEIAWANARIAANQSKNNQKSKWLVWSFRATAVVVGLNILTLILVRFTHLF